MDSAAAASSEHARSRIAALRQIGGYTLLVAVVCGGFSVLVGNAGLIAPTLLCCGLAGGVSALAVWARRAA